MTCAQVFYYFQNYSKKDGLGLKAVVRPDRFLSLQVFTLDRSLFLSYATRFTRRSSPTRVRSFLVTYSSSLTLRPVYTNLITYYFQPQELGTLIWYALVPFATTLSLTGSWCYRSPVVSPRSLVLFRPTHHLCPDRGNIQCEFSQCGAPQIF